MTRRRDALALSLGLALAVPALTGAASPSPQPQPQLEPELMVWLRGPFGTVVGTDPANPANAAPDGRPLGTWMREATLELSAQPPLAATNFVTLRATASEDGSSIELPLEDGRWVTGPDRPGEHTLLATVMDDGGVVSEHAWSLDVPDRPGSWETLLEMPAIEASLSGSSGSVVGIRGHGCYVDTCQEAGYRPPASSLEPLTVTVGEPLTLELDDGSALVGWEGRTEPQPGTKAETRLAKDHFDGPVVRPALTGLEPDRPGEWLLELRVDYDRERGWQWYLFRLIAE